MESQISIEHPRTMSTPTFMVTVLGIYLLLVTKIGPEFMLFRKPFQLKKLIITHNIVQVVSCIYVLFEVLTITENNIFLFWKCNAVEMTESRTKRHFSLAYFLFWLKLSELIETVIFVMRHKQNQVTKLHIFHHITTITLIYMLINHNDNGTDALFPVFLNSIVHIVMYTYYLIAAVADPSIVRALTPVKKSITMMQMTQFALIIFHAILASVNCGVNLVVFGYFMGVIILMFYGFYDFYQGSYKKQELSRREFAAASRAAAGEVPTKTMEVN
ncbi:elongation of very long chain fatty acids protein 7 [Drosophila sulfurigaster albostrigata]|uniref:elongation of very long chain fatty acids protein 7 n=1 Tax=Drosophila sulfurigaster albostrigata TaxID=89887 RepID=UPI002D21A410|nr:elongation of very long chain fatty acids protein 7 [Drosophila sulfurigaster albostrigata]